MFCLFEFVFCFALRDQAQQEEGGEHLSQQTTNNLRLSKRKTVGMDIWKESDKICFLSSSEWALSSLSGVWFTFPLFGCGYKWKEMIAAWQSPGGALACLPREVLLSDKNSATSRPHFCSQNSSHGSQVHSLQESSIESKISEIPCISHLNELE